MMNSQRFGGYLRGSARMLTAAAVMFLIAVVVGYVGPLLGPALYPLFPDQPGQLTGKEHPLVQSFFIVIILLVAVGVLLVAGGVLAALLAAVFYVWPGPMPPRAGDTVEADLPDVRF